MKLVEMLAHEIGHDLICPKGSEPKPTLGPSTRYKVNFRSWKPTTRKADPLFFLILTKLKCKVGSRKWLKMNYL